MADIFDYLKWRADVPFSVSPFNDVDNLILAELAYTDFGGIVPEEGCGLKDACEAFFAVHTKEEILESKAFTAKAPLLMEEMIKGPRFADMRIRAYIDEKGPDLQLSAVTFDLSDGTSYVAFRGTDGTVVGWKEDFNFSFLDETEGQRKAVSYLNGIQGRLRVGGHSKGGNLAVYASAFCEDQDKILEVYSNDGPGFREKIIQTEGFQKVLPKVRSIVPDTSVIGLLLAGQYAQTVVKSSASGLMQHDGFTWQVTRHGFEEAELSEASRLVDKTVSGWLTQMNDMERETLTETVFSLIESTGQDRFSDMNAQKLKTAEAMWTAARSLPREKQQEVVRLFKLLGQSGSHAAADYIAARIEAEKDPAGEGGALYRNVSKN